MNSQLLFPILLLVISFRQFPCAKLNEKLLTSNNLTDAQLKQVCGISPGSESRIVGGKDAKSDQWPWQAEIVMKGTFCGGSVINYYYILTAAHCVYKKNNDSDDFKLMEPNEIKIRLGNLNRLKITGVLDDKSQDNKTKIYQAKRIIPNEDYNPNNIYFYDIALIEVDQKIEFSTSIAPICLPTSPKLMYSDYDNETVVAIGWGHTEYRGNSSIRLQQVDLKVIPIPLCKKKNFHVTNEHVCTLDENGGKSTCQGDSGGPVMLRDSNGQWNQIGIVSYGTECGSKEYPFVDTRVAFFRFWIKKNAVKK